MFDLANVRSRRREKRKVGDLSARTIQSVIFSRSSMSNGIADVRGLLFGDVRGQDVILYIAVSKIRCTV